MGWVRTSMLNFCNDALRFRIISLKVNDQYYTVNDQGSNAGQARGSS